DSGGHNSSANLYAFCNGNPWAYWDADGRMGVSMLNAYGGGRMPFEYRLAWIMAQAGGGFEALYTITGVQQTWSSSAGPSVVNTTFNIPEIRQDWEELTHPDFSSGWGRAAFGTAVVGLPAHVIDAASNLLPGKALVEDAVKGGIKGLGKLFLKDSAEEIARVEAKQIAE